MIHAGATEQDIAAYAFRQDEPLIRSGLRAVAAGITSLSDVLRAASAQGPG